MIKQQNIIFRFLWLMASITLVIACTPTVQLKTPKEGITINMNVVVNHKISVEVDEETKKIIGKND